MADNYKEMKHKMADDVILLSDILKSELFSEEDKQILKYRYVENQDFQYIADMIGVSERTARKRHKKILGRVSSVIQAGLK